MAALCHGGGVLCLQELGLNNVERCGGFTRHLLALVVAQWRQLGSQWRLFTELKQAMTVLDACCRSNEECVSQQHVPALLV